VGVFEDRGMRNIYGPRRGEVTGAWRRLCDEELFYSVLLTKNHSGDKIMKNEMGGSCGLYGGQDRCTQGFGGKA
jgi:hypothetical protein